MPLFRIGAGCAKLSLVCAILVAGCSSTSNQRASVSVREPRPQIPPVQSRVRDVLNGRPLKPARLTSPEITAVNHEDPVDTLCPAVGDGEDLFAGQLELPLPLLVSEVQERNPSLRAALAAWGSAAERHPQVVALDDPMFQSMFAPASFSSSTIQSSYILGVGQKLPWFGKRALRGQVAEWNTVAASLDYQEVQLRLAEAARLAFYDYYSVSRLLELNEAGLEAVNAFRETARSKFEANQVSQQDILQADVELAKLEQRQVEIDQLLQVAIARINTLLHRQPQLPLPPPPTELEQTERLPSVDELRERAVEQRPDLSAMAARLQSEQSALALTIKDYYPDFEFMGKYDTFWTDPAQRGQVAMNLNIPLYQNRRNAAVREAMFRVNRLQAEYDQQVDLIRNEVQTAYAKLRASRRTLDLYTKKVLPAAQDNVAAAASGYTAGTVDFLRLIQAQRESLELQEKYQQAVVEYNRNRAELDRVVGTAFDQ
jgi:outer membrane protein, heavy metal efflux system